MTTPSFLVFSLNGTKHSYSSVAGELC